jgi:LytS/YehU family sensor histidine kinase
MMGALGNVLFLISFYAGPITQGVAFDLSLIGVFIAGLYGGPAVGLTAGIIAGILPGIMFGPLGSGGFLGLIGLPIGKALTGATTGLLAKALNLHQRKHASIITAPTILVAYIPEGIFTYAYFASLLPFFLNQQLGTPIILTILTKALVEVIIMSVIMAALIGNKGFSDFIAAHFKKQNTQKTASEKTNN